MGQVIQVCFTTRRVLSQTESKTTVIESKSKPKQATKSKRTKVLTKGELANINERVNEINITLDLCSDSDQDVIDNLQAELDGYIETIEASMALKKKAK